MPGYNSYNDIASLVNALATIDFGDNPEDGVLTNIPQFTGGDADLFPYEFSGRHGEGIPSAGDKINGNFSKLQEFLSAYRTFIADTVGKRSLYFDISASQIDPSVSSNQLVYIVNNMYVPYTLKVNKVTNEYAAGLYIKRGNIHRIYTHGYVNDIDTLIPGKTYGIMSNASPTPQPFPNGAAHIVNQDIIPVYRAVSPTDGILLPYRPLEGVPRPYYYSS